MGNQDNRKRERGRVPEARCQERKAGEHQAPGEVGAAFNHPPFLRQVSVIGAGALPLTGPCEDVEHGVGHVAPVLRVGMAEDGKGAWHLCGTVQVRL